jgi:hypothetical protein
LITNPVPVVVDVPVPVVVVVPVCDWRLAADVRSISDPPPRIIPASCVAVVLLPNASMSETVMEQSGFTI